MDPWFLNFIVSKIMSTSFMWMDTLRLIKYRHLCRGAMDKLKLLRRPLALLKRQAAFQWSSEKRVASSARTWTYYVGNNEDHDHDYYYDFIGYHLKLMASSSPFQNRWLQRWQKFHEHRHSPSQFSHPRLCPAIDSPAMRPFNTLINPDESLFINETTIVTTVSMKMGPSWEIRGFATIISHLFLICCGLSFAFPIESSGFFAADVNKCCVCSLCLP